MPEIRVNPDGNPVIVLQFENGWSCSLLMRRYKRTSLIAFPTGSHTSSDIEVEEQDATDDEVADWVAKIKALPPHKPN